MKVIDSFPFQKALFNKYLSKHKITKANVTKKDFITSVEEIRKTFKLKEGGKDYFFFTTLGKQHWVYHCIKPYQDKL